MSARKKSSSRKSKKSSSPMAKYKKTLMDVNECMSKTVKQIRKTDAYRKLVPFGTYRNKSNAYHFGNKSSLRKQPLCDALSNPRSYHSKMKKNKGTGKRKGPNKIKNSAKRKRYSRLGNCTPSRRKPPCKAPFSNSGLTTTAKKCCYKKAQSSKTKAKRRRNAVAKKSAKKKYDSNRSITQKSRGRRVRKSKRKSPAKSKRKSKRKSPKSKKPKRKSKRKSKR